MFIILVILGFCGAADGLAMQSVKVLPGRRLDSRIPAADRARYEAILDSGDWRNPYLLASATGFELKSASSPKPRVVLVQNLQQALADLPVSDWPYGRVVVVQSPSIVPADDVWLESMQRNIDDALKILKALGVDAWGWPA